MDVSTGGRIARIAVTVVLVGGILYGNLVGSDADWPFAPLRMYATTHDLDSPVGSTKMYGTTQDGERVYLYHSDTGLSRAEFEGQLPLYVEDPDRLSHVATAYENITGVRLAQINIQIEWFEMDDGYVTGRTWMEDVVSWNR